MSQARRITLLIAAAVVVLASVLPVWDYIEEACATSSATPGCGTRAWSATEIYSALDLVLLGAAALLGAVALFDLPLTIGAASVAALIYVSVDSIAELPELSSTAPTNLGPGPFVVVLAALTAAACLASAARARGRQASNGVPIAAQR